VEVAGNALLYKVLAVLEFNSDRKRMSVICRCVCVCAGVLPVPADSLLTHIFLYHAHFHTQK
jgi:magnesium-transporting ATPase (P-type)